MPPLSARIEFYCEGDGTLDAFFVPVDYYENVPLIDSVIISIDKHNPFSGSLGSMGFDLTKIKLIIRNTSLTADAHFYMKAYIV